MLLSQYDFGDVYFHHAYDDKPKQDDFPLHTNPTLYTVFYLLHGKGNYNIEGYEYTYKPNSIIIMRPNELRKHTMNCDYAFDRGLFYFSESILDYIDPEHKLLAPFNDRPLGVNNQYFTYEFSFDVIKHIVELCNLNTDRYLTRVKILSVLYPLLDDIFAAFKRKRREPSDEKPLSARVIEYVNNNIFEDLPIENITSKFYISSTQLWRIFKSATGYSPNNYIQLKRVSEAKKLIDSGVSANRAAVKCGYNDYSTFYRAYKKHFLKAPSE